MTNQSQAVLEIKLQEQLDSIKKKSPTVKQDFGELEDWVIRLGKRRVLLIPQSRQWAWYDQLHKEWVFAGAGIGEAILISVDGFAGLKKLPQPGNVADWSIYQQGDKLFGPLRTNDMIRELAGKKDLTGILVWSPLVTDWLSVKRNGIDIEFYDPVGNLVPIIPKVEVASTPPLPPVPPPLPPPPSIPPAVPPGIPPVVPPAL
jgi:hypothetical protein